MSDAADNNKLEAARARLESALSGLAQGVAKSKDANAAATKLVELQNGLEGKIASLEAENLKLHEQVAAYALTSENADSASERITVLEAEKAAIAANYQMLKEKYSALQDEMEAAATAIDSDAGAAFSENTRLKQVIAEMEAEKAAVRSELDKTISELETMVEEA